MTTGKVVLFVLCTLILISTAGIAVADETNKDVNESDTTPPESIINLEETGVGSNWIKWTWANPIDSDFSHVMVYIDSAFATNTSYGFYDSIGLTEGLHTISTKTVDTAGNINPAWINDSASTATVNVEFVYHFGGGPFDGRYDKAVISGEYAYICQNYNFIIIDFCDFIVLDLSGIDHPSKVGRVFAPVCTNDIDVSGSYFYGVGGDGLLIVDIADPSSPKLIFNDSITGNPWNFAVYPWRFAVSGNYAYIGGYFNGLVILDISDPSSPFFVGHYNTSDQARSIAVSGNYAYITDEANGLVIVNVTNPSTPTLVGSYDTAGYANKVAVAGNYAYIADLENGLLIMDISNPYSPILVGTFPTGGSAIDVEVSGNYAYVAVSDRLVIVDVSDPTSPKLAGSYDTNYSDDVAVSGNYVSLAHSYHGIIILKTEITPNESYHFNISTQVNDSSAKTTVEPPTETVEKPPIEPPEEPAKNTPGFDIMLALSAIGGTLLVLRRMK
jgi:hypothetical protein